MYDDFKLCGEGDFLKIAKEYSAKQKAQISSLGGDNEKLKQDFDNVLNLAKNAYFALEQSGFKGFSNIVKMFKNNNLELANEYERVLSKIFIPDIDKNPINKDKNIELKEIINIIFEFISKLFDLVFNNNLINLRKNIYNYLDIIKEILLKI